jgi:hypothetical protein
MVMTMVIARYNSYGRAQMLFDPNVTGISKSVATDQKKKVKEYKWPEIIDAYEKIL